MITHFIICSNRVLRGPVYHNDNIPVSLYYQGPLEPVLCITNYCTNYCFDNFTINVVTATCTCSGFGNEVDLGCCIVCFNYFDHAHGFKRLDQPFQRARSYPQR